MICHPFWFYRPVLILPNWSFFLYSGFSLCQSKENLFSIPPNRFIFFQFENQSWYKNLFCSKTSYNWFWLKTCFLLKFWFIKIRTCFVKTGFKFSLTSFSPSPQSCFPLDMCLGREKFEIVSMYSCSYFVQFKIKYIYTNQKLLLPGFLVILLICTKKKVSLLL